LVCL
jgi:hypothetical protein